MSWKKIALTASALILFFVALQRVVVNLYFFFSKSELIQGEILKIEGFTDTDGYSSMTAFYILGEDGKEYSGVYHDKEGYYLKKNDKVTFRNLYNGSVRVLKQNNLKIRSYYGFWDYGSFVTIILIFTLYSFYPKILNLLKK